MNLNEAYCTMKEIRDNHSMNCKIQNNTRNNCSEENIQMCDNESYAHITLDENKKNASSKI